MDYVSSAFTYNHDYIDELLELSSLDLPYMIQQDQFLLNPSSGSDIAYEPTSSKRRNSTAAASSNHEENPNETKKKKMIHRDIERQRRQKMATLFTSLRSLLPRENVKGKRSTSDDMCRALNYIRKMQVTIHEISKKRDELKTLSNLSTRNIQLVTSQNVVKVKACLAGVRVEISILRGIPLSVVLEFLAEEGLNTVSCTSTKVNERLLHIIESKVSDTSSIVLPELQQKLIRLINYLETSFNITPSQSK